MSFDSLLFHFRYFHFTELLVRLNSRESRLFWLYVILGVTRSIRPRNPNVQLRTPKCRETSWRRFWGRIHFATVYTTPCTVLAKNFESSGIYKNPKANGCLTGNSRSRATDSGTLIREWTNVPCYAFNLFSDVELLPCRSCRTWLREGEFYMFSRRGTYVTRDTRLGWFPRFDNAEITVGPPYAFCLAVLGAKTKGSRHSTR